MSLLKVTDLVVSYGGIEALKGISFEVDEGQIVTLIGANGAGKSTTLRTISGLVQPKDGRIYFEGRDITDYNTQKIVETGIAMVPEGRRVFANLTVLENLRIGAYLRKDKEVIEQDINYVYDLFPRLKERSWQLAGTLSGGEQQMLAVGRAVMTRPKLIMMDEPSLGLARHGNRPHYHLRHRRGAPRQRSHPGSLPRQNQQRLRIVISTKAALRPRGEIL